MLCLKCSPVLITGQPMHVLSFNDVAGSATFNTYDFSFNMKLNSTGVYHFYLMGHYWQKLRLINDCRRIDFETSPGSCLFSEMQIFDDKRAH